MTNAELAANANAAARELLLSGLPIRTDNALAFVPEPVGAPDRLRVAMQAACVAEARRDAGIVEVAGADQLDALVRNGWATEADCMGLKAAALRGYFRLHRPFGKDGASEHASYSSTKADMAEYIVRVAMPRAA